MTAAFVAEPLVTLAAGLTRDFLLHHRVCPKAFAADGTLIVAVTEDALIAGADDVAFAYQRAISLEVVSRDEVERLVERLTTRAERTVELARIDSSIDDLATDVRDLANQPPVIRYVNLLVRDAYDAGASDIHLEATRTGLAARFRVDGVLVPAPEPPSQLHHAVVSRIKLLAELDIAERRRPQDGRIRVRLEARELDLRVSTIPTMFGESVVLRLLDHGGRAVTLDELGMSARVLNIMAQLSARPDGMLLVTGPTGSGKTTTLYGALQRRDAHTEKIITVEDPIEYQLPGITQMPVHRQAGVTFGGALRAILRQDPDVVMIGEMRDQETAEISVQAAMTGHLVFSTLHTNDAVSAIPRLLDLGIPDYLVSATLEGVLAQRLVRRICDDCRVEYEPSPETVAAVAGRPIGRLTLLRGTGCPACRGTGFRGRLGIFELLAVTDDLRDAIAARASRAQLRMLAVEAGLVPLRSDGWQKVESGLTTVEEVARVVQN
ncbi:MAG: type secretion system protein GspE [Gemmatimonadetes bacterium]|nr:type secretion system protein GspE [Gemmatimonadota bacterium]